MRALTAVAAAAAGLTFAAIPACNCGFDPLETPRPHMIVQPKSVNIAAAPITQDTKITIQVSDPSIVNLEDITYKLTGENGQGDFNHEIFRLEDDSALTEV